MNAPPFLKAGDRVALAAPSRKVRPEELEAALALLRQHGLVPVYNPVLFGAFHQFSSDDEARAADLQHWLDSPDIQAIWLARGGYGLLRIVDRLHFDTFSRDPKWIIGFSDAGFLHRAVLSRTGIPVIHGPMAFNAGKNEAADSRLMRLLMGNAEPLSWNCNHVPDLRIRAKLDGGNLSIMYACMGSADRLEGHGGILFLEDLDEYLYHIDRMARALLRSFASKNPGVVLCGGFTDMKDHAIPFGYDAHTILEETFAVVGVPVLHGFPAGHIEANHAFVLGGDYSLSVLNGKAMLHFDGFI